MQRFGLALNKKMNWEQWKPQECSSLCFIVRGDEVLLIRKKRGLGAGKISAPGGRIEPGETPMQAAIRETQEEVGVTPKRIVECGEMSIQFTDGYALFCTLFIARDFEGTFIETDEAAPFWCDRNAIPYHEMWADDALWLPQILGRKRFRGRFVFDGNKMLEHETAFWPLNNKRRAIVVGAGFVGSETARLLANSGWKTSVISRSIPNEKSSRLAATVACDITNRDALEELRNDFANHEVLIDCVSSGKGGAEVYHSVYLDGARNLFEILTPKKMLFVSSSSVYAQTDGAWLDERSEAKPQRETGKILRETEELVLSHGGAVARLAGIYGPARSVLLRKFFSDEAVIEGDGARWINQIHRDDAANALAFLAERLANDEVDAEIFNVCDDAPMTQIECYRWLATHFQKPLPPFGERDLNRKRGWTSKRVSNEKLRALGWRCGFPSFQNAVENDPRLLDALAKDGG